MLLTLDLRRILVLVCLALGGASSVGATGAPDAAVGLVELEGTVNPGSADFLVRTLRAAEADGCRAVVIRLDTPGGMVESTREIVKAQLAAGIPVVVWVGPAGARAGSAGVFLTLAAHVAVMAPATNIGAAHPVAVGPGGSEEKPSEVMAEKMTNDLAAWARSIATQRGRSPEWAEKAVRESVSATVDEALELKVVDFQAPDLASVLRGLEGREVKLSSGAVKLATLGAPVKRYPMTGRERLLDGLGNPNIAFLLLGLGVLGILAELYHPGTLVPGIVGVVSLAVGVVATRVLPIRTGAVLLMLVGAGLVAAEFYLTSWGLLALAGVACLGLGGYLLVDPAAPGFLLEEGFGVEWSMVLPVVVTVAALLAVVVWKVAASRRSRETVGARGLVGEVGVVLEDVGPAAGLVRVHGELWQARSAQPIAPQRQVVVEQVAGLVVTVRPSEPQGGQS